MAALSDDGNHCRHRSPQGEAGLRLRFGRGDAEDLEADGGEDHGVETAILPLLQEHLGFFHQRRAGDGPAVREAEELPGKVEVTGS